MDRVVQADQVPFRADVQAAPVECGRGLAAFAEIVQLVGTASLLVLRLSLLGTLAGRADGVRVAASAFLSLEKRMRRIMGHQ